MVIVGAAILPHGALSFDGDKNSASEECRQRHNNLPDRLKSSITRLYEGCLEVGREVSNMSPDVIILDSPHGLVLSDSVAIYTNSTASGSASWQNHWQEFSVDVKCDEGIAGQLIDQLRRGGIPTEGLMSFSNHKSPLAWGEVIPLWYIQQALKNKEVRYVLMTTPRKPAGEFFDTSCDIGHRLAMLLHALPERIAVVISGDLSHVYPTDCKDSIYLPDPNTFLFTTEANPTSAKGFEFAIRNWVGSDKWTPGEAYRNLEEATALQSSALSCGIKGFQVLHGVLRHLVDTGSDVMSRVYTCEAPSYYGMMGAVFRVARKAEAKAKSPK